MPHVGEEGLNLCFYPAGAMTDPRCRFGMWPIPCRRANGAGAVSVQADA